MGRHVRICGLEDERAIENAPALRIEIRGVDDPDYLDQLNIELQTLLLTRKGTLPGSRGYGMEQEFLDHVTPESVNLFAIELDDAVSTWIPDITLTQVKHEVLDDLGQQNRYVAIFELTGESEATV